nr:hypothetical protein [Tanacetum cinerariifolium]
MRTRSSSNLPGESSPNPTSSNPKRRNRRRSKQPFILKESLVDTMADQCTMAELLRVPTEGYAEAFVVPLILSEQFKLKQSLINMMTSDQFFRLEKDNPHDHICWFNKITSTIKYRDVHNSATKLMLFSFSLARAARRWLEKEPSRSILTWEDLVSKFINVSKSPIFNNGLMNRFMRHGGNLLERRTQDVLMIIKNKSKVCNSQNKSIVSQVKSSDANSSSSSEIAKLTHALNQQTSVVTTAMTTILKQFQATPPPASVKAVEEICITCGGAHLYYQCLATDGKTFPKLWDNIQGYVSAAAVNCNQGYNLGNGFNQDQSYQALTQQNQVVPLTELEKIKRINEANMKSMQTQINNVKNELRNEMKYSIQASMSNQTNKLKNMMASFFQMNTASTLGSGPLPSNTIANPKGELKAITNQSGIVLDGPSVPMPPPFINSKEDERVEETLTDQDLAEYTIKVPPPLLHINITLADALILILKYQKMLKALLSNKEKLLELANTPLNENCLDVILKKLPEKLGDLGNFSFPNFVIVDYESDPRVPLILGRPFLRTARALIDVHGEEMILRDGDERLTLNMRHDTSSYSNHPQKESINMINIFDDSCEDFLEDLFVTNHLSGNLTFSSHPNLTSLEVKDDIFDPEGDMEFADELALITFPLKNDDLSFDIESDLKEIEYLLNHDPIKEMDSILKDSVDEDNLADLNDNLVDTMPKMFTDEHDLDYSSPPLYDEYDDDVFEVKSDTEYVYDDLFNSKEDEIKESKLLIDELDPLRSSDFLPSPKYESFLFKDFSEVDALPSTNNEDKVFNL